MRKLCLFMVCAAVSFCAVVLSAGTYERLLAGAYSKRVNADFLVYIMASKTSEVKPDA